MNRDERAEGSHAPVIDPWAAIAYLLSGVAFWGGVGWLADQWLNTRFLVAIGIVLGAAAGVYLVFTRMGRS